MKRALIIGAALLVQAVAAQQPNVITDVHIMDPDEMARQSASVVAKVHEARADIEKRIARAYADGAKTFGLIGVFIGALAFAGLVTNEKRTPSTKHELETLRARVAKLERLEITGVYQWGTQVSAMVRLPTGSTPARQKTLGQAIPTKGTR